jgi:cyclopropane fatty-acyl-phospholipid synthase-like methyltransferase
MNSLQVPKSIQIAREKAAKNQLNIRFEVVNILDDLSKAKILKQHSYDTVLDAAVFHFFSNENRQHYIQNLEYLIKPGGLYIQLCFSEKQTFANGPRRMKKSDLNELFSSKTGWTIESIDDSVYEFKPNAPTGPSVQAYLSFIRRNNNT